jgi:hypothetical protein
MTATTIEWIKKHGSTARGKRELIAFLRGETLTMKESILANCYECMGLYMDGRRDSEVEGCPLHVFMPYRKGGAVKVRKVSEETKAKMRKARDRKARDRKARKIDSVAVG